MEEIKVCVLSILVRVVALVSSASAAGLLEWASCDRTLRMVWSMWQRGAEDDKSAGRIPQTAGSGLDGGDNAGEWSGPVSREPRMSGSGAVFPAEDNTGKPIAGK